jgi:hypothetical protein
MKIKGNIQYKDNVKLAYLNLGLTVILILVIFLFYKERNYKPIIAVDTAHSSYTGQMMFVPERKAIEGQLKAHINMGYHYLYDLSEKSYWPNVKNALELWSYEGLRVVQDYQKEGLHDIMSSTPTKTEVIVLASEITGQKMLDNLKYPEYNKSDTTGISFAHRMINNVQTYTAKVKTYHRVIRGNTILAEEYHYEEIEIYTGFAIDPDQNPFGYKLQTTTRTVEPIK